MLRVSEYFKVKVTVPNTNADEVRSALGKAGAGRLGNYDFCSYSYPVNGKFRSLDGATPAIGEIGELTEVREELIECICHKDILESVIKKLRDVHPYEKPAIDIMPRYEVE
jgi:hypothetical protein